MKQQQKWTESKRCIADIIIRASYLILYTSSIRLWIVPKIIAFSHWDGIKSSLGTSVWLDKWLAVISCWRWTCRFLWLIIRWKKKRIQQWPINNTYTMFCTESTSGLRFSFLPWMYWGRTRVSCKNKEKKKWVCWHTHGTAWADSLNCFAQEN